MKNTQGGFLNLIIFIIIAFVLLKFFGANAYGALVWIIDAIRDLLVGLLNILRQIV